MSEVKEHGTLWPRDRKRPAATTNGDAIAAMERSCAGDVSGFRALYAITTPRLFTYVRCLVRDRALSEELLQ